MWVCFIIVRQKSKWFTVSPEKKSSPQVMFHHPQPELGSWDRYHSCSPCCFFQAHARARFSHRVEREDFDEAMRLMKASKVSKTKQQRSKRSKRNNTGNDAVVDVVGWFFVWCEWRASFDWPLLSVSLFAENNPRQQSSGFMIRSPLILKDLYLVTVFFISYLYNLNLASHL